MAASHPPWRAHRRPAPVIPTFHNPCLKMWETLSSVERLTIANGDVFLGYRHHSSIKFTYNDGVSRETILFLEIIVRCQNIGITSAMILSMTITSVRGDNIPAMSGQVYVPESSIENSGDVGVRAHTNVRIFVPNKNVAGILPPMYNRYTRPLARSAPYSGYYYIETPASLGCVYSLVSPVLAGCNPYATMANPVGGSKAIAIVDAYDDPTAASDLASFSSQFGLSAANFQVVYASGKKPAANSGWQVEEALDVEWAHAMAPLAKIYLVEAASSSIADLLTAVGVASQLVTAAGGGEVSMSWGGGEFSSQTSYDHAFATPGVVYLASAGDSPGVLWPSSSPNVISVGGTALSRNPTTGAFQGEVAWQQGGGGPSAYEAVLSAQAAIPAISQIVGSKRGTPDVSAVADPTTGVWVYSAGAWNIVGGTSVAAPVWAGILNLSGVFYSSTSTALNAIYVHTSGYNGVTSGDCGPYEGYLAQGVWSFCTGNGSPNGTANK